MRDLRNAALGLAVVVGGIGLAGLTAYAHFMQRPRLAGIAAGTSLVFVLLILIFVVPPLAKNAGREASQMNLPFEFTAGGAIILGLITIVGLSAWNTGNNLLFLILSFLLASMVVGFLAGSMSLKDLEVKMRFPETIFAGEETPILVSITNQKRFFPSYSIVAEVRGKEREESVAAAEVRKLLPQWFADRLSRPPILRRTLGYFVHIPRRQSSDSTTTHVFPASGHFLIRDFELSTRFPFGFFRHRHRLPAKETELVVFPRLEPFDDQLIDDPLDLGKQAANKRGSGQDLLALREYLPNDDLRRVDWKATARTSSLTVREFAAEDDKRVTVIFDPRLPADEPRLSLRQMLDAEQKGENMVISPRFENGLSSSASILAHFSEQQAEIRLIIGRESGEFGVGSRHLFECLRRLAVIDPVMDPEADVDLECAENEQFAGEVNSHCFVVTAGPDAARPELAAEAVIVAF